MAGTCKNVSVILLTVFCFCFTSAYAVDAPRTAIVNVTIANPEGFPLAENATVLIEGDTIAQIASSETLTPPVGATIIDGSGKWLIPGLMDLHVHFHSNGASYGSYEGGLPRRPWLQIRTEAPLMPQMDASVAFRSLARAGITTVRSVGEAEWAYRGKRPLRERAANDPMAPRLVLSTPGFYPRPDRRSFERITSPEQGVEMVAMFDDEVGVDLLKIWFVHGKFTGEPDTDDDWKKLLPIVEAMLAEATRRGLPNGVDAIEAWKAKAIIPFGADLVHGIFFGDVDDEYISLMKEHEVDQVWTLIASERYFGAVAGQLQLSTPEFLMSDPKVIAQLFDVKQLNTDRLVIPSGGSRFDGLTLTQAMEEPPYTEEIVVAVENLRKVHEAGIPFGVGTDVGITGIPFGAGLFAEFEHYVTAGLTPREILTAATINNADIIDMADTIGSVSEGKKADLVLLNADPLIDIMNAADIAGVMRNGRFFTADELNDDTPQDVATRLRNSFNGGNLEAVRALLHDDVVYSPGGDAKSVSGRSAVATAFAGGADGKAFRGKTGGAVRGSVVTQKEVWNGEPVTVRYVVTDKKISEIKIVGRK